MLQSSLCGLRAQKAWLPVRKCTIWLLHFETPSCPTRVHRQLWNREGKAGRGPSSPLCSLLKHSDTWQNCGGLSVHVQCDRNDPACHFPLGLQLVSPAAVRPPGEPCGVQYGAHERQRWSHGTDEHELHAHGRHAHGSWSGMGVGLSLPFVRKYFLLSWESQSLICNLKVLSRFPTWGGWPKARV